MVIYINGEITQEVANSVRDQLAKSKDPIELHIDSQGGDVFAGLSIYNMLQRRDVKVYVDGLAGSIASVIALSGDERPQISETGTFAIHNALINQTQGNHHELRQVASSLEKFSDIVASVYEKKTNLKLDEIKELMNAESIFTADEAVQLGFAKEIYTPLKAMAYFKNIASFIMLMFSPALFAQYNTEETNLMVSDGKIYVVVAVAASIVIGLLLYLIATDKKVTRLEKELEDKLS